MTRPQRPPSDFRSTRCVVTGGLGFIGSNTVHRLVADGAHVIVIDALVDGHGGAMHNVAGLDVEIVEAEIGAAVVAEAIRDAEVIFNLAGQVSHTDSMRDPLRDLHLNAIAHATFLETVRAVNPTVRIVHASTRQVYGAPEREPVDETHPTHPLDVNGVAKLAGEQLHMVYAKAFDVPATSLRLTNVYGPRQRLSSDVLGFLPVFIRRALRDEEIRIFGDGSQRRDCLHVDDVVAALFAACDPRAVGQVLNVGDEFDSSLADIAKIIVHAADSASDVTLVPWPDEHRRIDIGSFRTDSARLRHLVGWRPTISLADGLQATIDFYRGDPWYLSST